jgi:hypothetical protein
LPESPRTLELQLQGDDLVEVFLMFSQNVFGLEPATVRVREVRIGRAERRAARRRARELRAGETISNESEAQGGEDDANVNVSIGVTVSVNSAIVASDTGDGQSTPTLTSADPQDQRSMEGNVETTVDVMTPDRPSTPTANAGSAAAPTDELVAIATAQMGPYTTFQQLSFAPRFPLASIADDYIIPPTYPDFLHHCATHETETSGSSSTGVSIAELAQVQFSPPGLPVPTPSAPTKWYYRDPKNVIHGESSFFPTVPLLTVCRSMEGSFNASVV